MGEARARGFAAPALAQMPLSRCVPRVGAGTQAVKQLAESPSGPSCLRGAALLHTRGRPSQGASSGGIMRGWPILVLGLSPAAFTNTAAQQRGTKEGHAVWVVVHHVRDDKWAQHDSTAPSRYTSSSPPPPSQNGALRRRPSRLWGRAVPS